MTNHEVLGVDFGFNDSRPLDQANLVLGAMQKFLYRFRFVLLAINQCASWLRHPRWHWPAYGPNNAALPTFQRDHDAPLVPLD